MRVALWPEIPCEVTARFGDDVHFAYEVDGRRYEATQSFRLVQGGTPREYQQGAIVTCRVNPGDPSQASLNRQGPVTAGIFSVIALLPFLLVLLWLLRQWREAAPISPVDEAVRAVGRPDDDRQGVGGQGE